MANDTIRVAFGAGNTANANLVTLGTHTVQVTTGTNITDASAAANPANTAPAAVTVSGTPAGRVPEGGSDPKRNFFNQPSLGVRHPSNFFSTFSCLLGICSLSWNCLWVGPARTTPR